jgi:hypothetical protein
MVVITLILYCTARKLKAKMYAAPCMVKQAHAMLVLHNSKQRKGLHVLPSAHMKFSVV